MDKISKVLFEALFEAKDHLEYCNYGDAWERECAIDDGLREKIESAIDLYRKEAL